MAGNELVPPYRTPDQIVEIDKIDFRIQNLLSPSNLMNKDSVKVLQKNLNKYVYGSKVLNVDGDYGPKTHNAIKQYRGDRRYWKGHMYIDINPITMGKAYSEE